jgi:hypothetical protein
MIQRAIAETDIADGCRVAKKSKNSTGHVMRALYIVKQRTQTDRRIDAARRVLVERFGSKG